AHGLLGLLVETFENQRIDDAALLELANGALDNDLLLLVLLLGGLLVGGKGLRHIGGADLDGWVRSNLRQNALDEANAAAEITLDLAVPLVLLAFGQGETLVARLPLGERGGAHLPDPLLRIGLVLADDHRGVILAVGRIARHGVEFDDLVLVLLLGV